MTIAIGIDLGTTNTVVAAVVNGAPTVLTDHQQRPQLPSVVSFHPSGSVLVGAVARERRLTDAENTIYSAKRFIGRPWNASNVQHAVGKVAFTLAEGPMGRTTIVSRGINHEIPELSALVLRRAKEIAEAALGTTVRRAVVSVPGAFDEAQRAATELAVKKAGLELLALVNAPSAVALAYAHTLSNAERIAVYDFGGGSFDIALFDVSKGAATELHSEGDTNLGGDEIDLLIADRIAEEVADEHGFDPRKNYAAFGRLRMLAESIKRDLSSATEASVEIRDLGYGEGGAPITHRFLMTRADLEGGLERLVHRTMQLTHSALGASGLKAAAIERLVLTGGCTRMPLVARTIEGLLRAPAHRFATPHDAVALGAAIIADSHEGAR
jgi:molecular chaperone DnaK